MFDPGLWEEFPKKGYESITMILPQYLYPVGGYLPTKNYLVPGTPSPRNKPFCFMSDVTPDLP